MTTKCAEADGFSFSVLLGRRASHQRRYAYAAASMILLALPLHAQYTSINLSPPGGAPSRLNGVAGGQQVGVFGANIHGLLLTGTPISAVDLHPPSGFINSLATSTDGIQQCGYGIVFDLNQAILWSGTAASNINLTPSSFNQSYCFGVYHGQQVGWVESVQYITTTQHAAFWSGAAATYQDFHPFALGFAFSKALGLFAGQQVGYVSSYPYPAPNPLGGYETGEHAVLWNGTAASAVDLHPAGFDSSAANATNGVQQGGWAYSAASAGGSHLHAMMWLGAAASAVDLHPAGYVDTRVNAMSGNLQVGEGWDGPSSDNSSARHAFVWSGTAASVIDLNPFLPPGYKDAAATGVDEVGNIVGYAYNTPPVGTALPADAIAVMWIPGAPKPWAISSVSITPSTVAPGGSATGTVTLAGPAPAGGATITFLSTNTSVAPSPASIVIAAGQTSGTFPVTTNAAAVLTVPTAIGIWASDGAVSKFATLTVVPVVKLTGISITPVQGGMPTSGFVTLNIPAQTGGATVTLTSSHPTAVTLPATITVPQGATSASFQVTTTAVKNVVNIPVSATYNGVTVTGTATLNPAPVVALAAISVVTPVTGGEALQGTVVLTNPATGTGVTVNLVSGATALATVPATVLVPAGSTIASFTGTTAKVLSTKTTKISAAYHGIVLSTTLTVNPEPPVTIVDAQYLSMTKVIKVAATTPLPHSVLTFGIDPAGSALGTLTWEAKSGNFQGSAPLGTAPSMVIVWNSNGGSATSTVVVKNK